MVGHVDPFDLVKTWWGNRPISSDTAKVGINPSTKDGAFECLILGILYSIEDEGQLAEDTLVALRSKQYTNTNSLVGINAQSQQWQNMLTIFDKYYQGRLRNLKVKFIVAAAERVTQDLNGDLRKLYTFCSGNGDMMLTWLWQLRGMKKKSFWVMREMHMHTVWPVNGNYCCVPDKQVGSSLERWGKITTWPKYNNFKILLNCSKIMWSYFGQLYDLPILTYARDHKCNQKYARQCTNCAITACSGRGSSMQSRQLLVTPTKYCTVCGVQTPSTANYCPTCGAKQV